MGFDQYDAKPIIDPAKKTTRVNIGMAVGVAIFFLFSGLAIVWMISRHG
jgi:hypothetical protein